MRPKAGKTYDGPTEMEALATLTSYNLPSVEEVKQGLEGGKANGVFQGERLQAIEGARHGLLHDVYAFAEAYPEYERYGDILEQHGLELNAEQRRAQQHMEGVKE
ncbi:hypothetical protein [Parafannyhessea umbonata]|uniref:hypothetical protein n=1 Tax=Atopobiaceae TaxID=1643824 RepID=UPI00359C5977